MAGFRALLIGNWEYQDPDRVFLPLKGPKFDLKAMKEALTDEVFGLCRPADGEVTVKENLDSTQIGVELSTFVKSTGPDDVVLIYYSGHGARLPGGSLGLCGVTTRGSSTEAMAFNSDSLRWWLDEQTRARSKVVVLDCCYAGGFKGGGDDSQLAVRFGAGTYVLKSSGSTTAPDAADDDAPSPFTERLAEAMLDEAIEGDSNGFADADAIYQRMFQPSPLQPPPERNIAANGLFPLARRAVARVGGGELPDFDRIQSVEEVGVAFGADGVTVTGLGALPPWPLDGFDEYRQAAVRRMAQLADATIRGARDDSESDRRAAVKAWECLGVNLFETAFPEQLRERLKQRDERVERGEQILKLVLSFDEDAASLEQYPWELLQFYERPADRGSGARRLPLAQQTGLLVERRSRNATPRPAKAPAGAGSPGTVAVVNTLSGPLAAAGNRVVKHLEDDGVSLTSDERAATWASFVTQLKKRPDYLLLFAPVRRREGDTEVWFTVREVSEGWQPASEVADALRTSRMSREDRFEAIVLVTFSAYPGEDCARGVIEAARVLADADVGPVVFVCHAPAYVQSDTDDLPTFASLLVRALQQGKDLDRSVYWARDHLCGLTTGSVRQAIGVPGYYTAPSAKDPPRGEKTGRGIAAASRPSADRSERRKEPDPSAGE